MIVERHRVQLLAFEHFRSMQPGGRERFEAAAKATADELCIPLEAVMDALHQDQKAQGTAA